jgi:bifunctional DNA-binding transcriptional regulator/antitoxin component of YhaV-PrlF toxin-antitoxin module
MMPVRVAENLKLRAETQLVAAERAVASAGSIAAKEQAEETKAAAAARVAELEARLVAAKAELQPKLDAVAPAREAAVAAETARVVAADAAREVARDLAPVSVFISRKTQRLYVRQAFQPILESPVTIRDADRPIGTHVFTAIQRAGGDDMRWSVVSLKGGQGTLESPGLGGPNTELSSTDTGGAKAALDRITIPQEARDRMEASPGSSLIISDEALSSETGKGTEFVVIMSDEPQGGIKMRRRSPDTEFRYVGARNRLPYWSPFAGPYSRW